MAIYRLEMKQFKRDLRLPPADRYSPVAAAAYRSCTALYDSVKRRTFDYTKKQGWELSGIIGYGGKPIAEKHREKLWNRYQKSLDKRSTTVSYETLIAIPDELSESPAIMHQAVKALALEISKRFGVMIDFAIHKPKKIRPTAEDDDTPSADVRDDHGEDNKNWHAHMLLSAGTINKDMTFGPFAAGLDPIRCQRAKTPNAAELLRPVWEKICNEALERAGSSARVDCRTNLERGIPEPTEPVKRPKPNSRNAREGRSVRAPRKESLKTRKKKEAELKKKAVKLQAQIELDGAERRKKKRQYLQIMERISIEETRKPGFICLVEIIGLHKISPPAGLVSELVQTEFGRSLVIRTERDNVIRCRVSEHGIVYTEGEDERNVLIAADVAYQIYGIDFAVLNAEDIEDDFSGIDAIIRLGLAGEYLSHHRHTTQADIRATRELIKMRLPLFETVPHKKISSVSEIEKPESGARTRIAGAQAAPKLDR